MGKINNLRVLRKKEAIEQYNMKHRKFKKNWKEPKHLLIFLIGNACPKSSVCVFSSPSNSLVSE